MLDYDYEHEPEQNEREFPGEVSDPALGFVSLGLRRHHQLVAFEFHGLYMVPELSGPKL
jgi:hypothetical protein